MNRNKTYNCQGNEAADNLLCALESNSVLSESFNTKIRNILLVIITNLEKNEDWVKDAIKKLEQELNWLMIFSTEFKTMLIGELLLALHEQKALDNAAKKSVIK